MECTENRGAGKSFLTADMENYARSVQGELRELLRDLCTIPAPSNHEERRAEFCKAWFERNGFKDVRIDDAFNVLAPVNVDLDGGEDLDVMMAHTDIVFPEETPLVVREEGDFWHCPGIGDDTANLVVLMVCARYFKEHFPAGRRGILFVANSGEEGLGNLKGSRKIVETFRSRIREFVSLDSACMNRLVVRAVGSHRYKVTVRTEGGHSFAKFGNRNAIHALASMISLLYSVKVPSNGDSKTTYNVGTISGGTSVNTIAQNAEMMYEYRSDDRSCLEKMEKLFKSTIETFRATGVEVEVEKIGDRPCGGDVDPVRLEALRDRYCASVRDVLGLEVFGGSSSTDCNIPLSQGIPAICFGVCRSVGAHTLAEKVDVSSLHDGCRLLLDLLYRN